jgi:hypothetical protein
VTCHIDAANANACSNDIDLVDATGILRNPPIGRQRLIQQLNQERAVNAVVRDDDHGLIQVALED